MNSSRSLNSFLRIIYAMMFGSLGVYWFVMTIVPAPTHMNTRLEPLPTGLAALAAIGFFYIRFVRIERLLSLQPADDGARVAQLRQLWIVSFMLSDAVGLCGFALYLIGGSRNRSAIFFLAASALFILCYPKLPAPSQTRQV